MDLFDKATKMAKDVGNSVKSTAATVGSNIGSVTKEQSELASLKIQRKSLEKKLEGCYAEIGKKYVEYVSQSDVQSQFEVSDIIESINPDLDKMAELNQQINELMEKIRQNNLEREKKKAQDQFEQEQKKLEKALEMDVLSQEEYDEKLAFAQKKLDNSEQLRKYEIQYEMGIISAEEYEQKVKALLN